MSRRGCASAPSFSAPQLLCIISGAFCPNASHRVRLSISVFLHLACRGRSFSSRDANARTHIHLFSLLSACYITIFVRLSFPASYNYVNPRLCCASGLPVARSITSRSTLADFGYPSPLRISVSLRPFLRFILIFRLFCFSHRPPTSLPIHLKLKKFLFYVCIYFMSRDYIQKSYACLS